MTQIAQLFRNGRSQAVRLPAAYRFEGVREVYVRRDPATGDVILSRRPPDWQGFFAALQDLSIDEGFLGTAERAQGGADRDPLAGFE